MLTKIAGQKAHKVFTSGFKPAATYGAAIYGLSNPQLLRLRKLAAKSMAPFTGWFSRTTKLALHGDPLAVASASALIGWGAEVWSATAGVVKHSFGLGQLAGFRAGASATRPTRRADVTGPMGAMFLEADRLGWVWCDPFSVTSDLGEKLQFTKTPPS